MLNSNSTSGQASSGAGAHPSIVVKFWWRDAVKAISTADIALFLGTRFFLTLCWVLRFVPILSISEISPIVFSIEMIASTNWLCNCATTFAHIDVPVG
jgi:hypothetical protein